MSEIIKNFIRIKKISINSNITECVDVTNTVTVITVRMLMLENPELQ